MADQTTPEVQDLFGNEFATAAPVAAAAPLNEVADESDGEPVIGVTTPDSLLERTIDLGDGGGKQVFKAKTPEEMIEKLTKAQENATRKIRQQEFELQRQKRATPDKTTPTRAPKQLTADDKFALAQEMAKDPEAALDKLLAAKGITTADLNQIVTDRAVQAAELTFLQKHEGVDFLPTPDNAKAIQKFLQDEQLPYTAANLEYAFQELSEGGLLDMPSSDATNSADGEISGQEKRIVVPEHTRRKPMSTGLTQKQGAARPQAAPTTQSGLTESEVEELYRLPEEQARTKMLAHMRRLEASGSR